VGVTMNTTNGDTKYIYTITPTPNGPNANKFFAYVKGRQGDGQGLQGDLVGTINGTSSGVYVVNGGSGAANCPPSTAWSNKTDDGWCFTSISTSNQPTLTVSERYQPAEGTTMVILSCSGGSKQCTGGDTQVCGPILGPTTPAAAGFPGTPLVNTVSTKTFASGCIYDVTAGERDNIITSMSVSSHSPPFETIGCGGIGEPVCKPCAVTIPTYDYCTAPRPDGLDLVFCPPGELGRPPIQSEPGGLCFYPPNLLFPC
jgi:hypothetical protein